MVYNNDDAKLSLIDDDRILPEHDSNGQLTFRELFENDPNLPSINWYYSTSPMRVFEEYSRRNKFNEQ